MMNHDQIEMKRQTPGASVLLFITDRCPVACDHCSVNSSADSPMISDFSLFRRLVQGIALRPDVQVVGISGGEPFAERRGLSQACDLLTAQGKSIVVYTSGIWASPGGRKSAPGIKPGTEPGSITVGRVSHARSPAWIQSVLKQCCTVYLSTDSFHQARASSAHFIHAARRIAEAGAWIVVQTLEAASTEQLLHDAFGDDYGEFAEIVELTPLRNGRGSQVFPLQQSHPARSLGTCALASTPVIRYDGWVSSCCNEDIIMGKGPARFRRQVETQQQLDALLASYLDDPLMRCVAKVGLGNLTEHPDLRHLTRQRYLNNCELCWKISDQYPSLAPADRLIQAIAELGETI
jgi:organic radical activating enzyme